jgi:hypothetical protein
MVEAVRKFLDGKLNGDKCHYTTPADIAFKGKISGLTSKIGNADFCIVVGDDAVTCFHTMPFSVPEEQRPAVSEFITRANYKLAKGCFAMDYSDGSLCYKMNVSAWDILSGDDRATLRNMQMLLMLGANMCDRYGDNLLALLIDSAEKQNIAALVKQCEPQE